ncbi:MAG: tryptophanase [Bacteroidales bacterium]|jgi:tyrosine phenol-lyase
MISEPHKIKTVRNINFINHNDRVDTLLNANYNTFHIHSGKVIFDMTSQGTSAVSQEQISGLYIGDETYAGSRNFEYLEKAVLTVFGYKHVCPTHNVIGAHKLITTTMVTSDNTIFANSKKTEELTKDYNSKVEVLIGNESVFQGNIDINSLKQKIDGKKVPYIYIELFADGYKPVSIENIKEVQEIAKKNNTIIVLNGSYIVSNALYIKENSNAYKNASISDIVKNITKYADVFVIDAGQEPRANAGGMIATNNDKLYDMYMNEVVAYEGLHTYGGMAGRTIEVFARGIEEMIKEEQAAWIYQQINLLSTLIKNIPHFKGADGVYINANEFLSNIKNNQSHTLAAALYLKSGVRAFIQGIYTNCGILPLQIPRLSFTNEQIKQIAEAVNELYNERNIITELTLTNKPSWNDEAIFKWKRPILNDFKFNCEPFIIYTFEYIGEITREEREKHAKEAGYNTFLLLSKHVGIDLLTDSGTCAQTVEQWAKYQTSSETQASSDDYFNLVKELQEVTGYKYIIPTHQGRAAEHIMSQCLIKGGFVPGNMYFTTTKLHQEMAGGAFADVIVNEAHDPQSNFQWKGNIDIKKIDAIVKEHGAKSIPYISFELSVNLAGGQPVSMQNAKDVYNYCEKHNIPVMFDATRAVENAYMIKKKDPDYCNVSIKDILRELFSYGHGCTVSAKKDYLVNIGGFLAIKDDEIFYKDSLEMLRKYEGSVTNGGLSAGDLAVFAQGVREMVDEKYIMARVEQTQYLGKKLMEGGVPIVEPAGTHAIFLDAKRFLPHVDQDEYPAQSLATAIYIESGIRAMERGNVSKGRDPKTGKNYRPALELVRLTIPRRAYTNAHMDLVAEGIINVYKKRDSIKGLKFTYEPDKLRFFQGRFEKV